MSRDQQIDTAAPGHETGTRPETVHDPFLSLPIIGVEATAAPAPGLRFEVTGVEEAAAESPALRFEVRVDNPGGPPIRSLMLNTQIRITAAHRAHDQDEREPSRRAPRSLLWARVATQVPAFTGGTVTGVEVPCGSDYEVAAAQFFHAGDSSDVPLEFLFGGTAFYVAGGRLQVAHLRCESGFRMPVRVWQDLMDRCFPSSAWVRLSRDAFDRLHAYRVRHTLTGWDDVVTSLLKTGGD
ncbi:hypothetical protein HII36_45080 [Nonomuraea sp. NN258]|uniref:DUF6084 family protein n=1 Tax=Nonomuraea antri TaxID=2730852 RepID=UPI00156931D4|nr:DUF6084 family protein [Nonomuraea antri]NRQ38947.1 hypothetical protein [Nonomuraea antri]